jgi:alkylation response protein AidB-like acyl-CoA dehydrogenase
VQHPCGTPWRQLGDQWLEDVHHRRAQLPVRLLDHQHRPRCAEAQEPDHVSVPLDSPGIEIQGIRTVDGDRTNIVYYSDVRVDDKYRLGEVNDG